MSYYLELCGLCLSKTPCMLKASIMIRCASNTT
uniref:Uncharacterized protein n=1 Tax=Rhizophora mucronata TaxID=61149 RepID=A0A2P2MZC3_RHIMU